MRVAIRVAADYAHHLHRDDRVPREAAIKAAVRAVVRAHWTERRSGLGEGEERPEPRPAGGWLLSAAIITSGLAAGGKLLGLLR